MKKLKKGMVLIVVLSLAMSLLAACGVKTSKDGPTSTLENKKEDQQEENNSQNSSESQNDLADQDNSENQDNSSNQDDPKEDGDVTLVEGSFTIGVGQFAEHGSLDNCREGFLEGLRQSGFVEGENLTVLYDNAQADGGMASQINDNYIAQKVNLICSIATPMAQSAYSTARKQDIPVIYTAVTDPVAAELAGEDKMPVGEVTGTSDKLPVEKQLEMIRQVLPDATKIGILYCTSEVNSESAIAEYKAAAPNYGFEIVTSAVSTTAEVAMATDQLLPQVDCINNLTDNTVVSALKVILDKSDAAGKPVFGSEIEQVRNGCLATVGLDYIDLGIQTGKMAAAVLSGEKKASEIPFEVIVEAAFYGNNAVAEKLNIPLPEELTKNAAEMFSEIVE